MKDIFKLKVTPYILSGYFRREVPMVDTTKYGLHSLQYTAVNNFKIKFVHCMICLNKMCYIMLWQHIHVVSVPILLSANLLMSSLVQMIWWGGEGLYGRLTAIWAVSLLANCKSVIKQVRNLLILLCTMSLPSLFHDILWLTGWFDVSKAVWLVVILLNCFENIVWVILSIMLKTFLQAN